MWHKCVWPPPPPSVWRTFLSFFWIRKGKFLSFFFRLYIVAYPAPLDSLSSFLYSHFLKGLIFFFFLGTQV